jgi:xylulokinase
LQGERAPLWDSRARGAFFGLATHHGRGELYRSVVEGVSCALRSVLDVFAEHGEAGGELRLIGGGAKSDLWRGALAALAGRSLGIVAEQASATSMGASMAAGVGAGLHKSIEAAAQHIKIARQEHAKPDQVRRYEDYYRRWGRIYPAVKGLY